jgi:hypothetical protein
MFIDASRYASHIKSTVIISITMMLVCGDILEGFITDGTAHADG